MDVVFDAEPSLLIGYHRPSITDPDTAAFEAIAHILGEGKTSRFNRQIVEKTRIGVGVWAGSSAPGERDPHLFVMGGAPRAPHTTQELEKAMLAEVDLLRTQGPTPHELEKVKNDLEGSLIRGLDSNEELADQLAYYEGVGGDWMYIFKLVEGIRKLTPDDIKRVMNKYFVPTNRTVATLVKKGVIASPQRAKQSQGAR